MKIDDRLSEKFDIEPIQENEIITASGEVLLPENTSFESNVNYDYEKTRSNLHTLLAQGQDALVYALELAKETEHPRCYEVVGNLVKQLAEVNNQLLDLSEKRQKLIKAEPNKQPSSVVNNAIFVGSTNDLKQFIHNLNKGD